MDDSRDQKLAAYLAERDVACPGCGYNLRGVTGGVCPECGRELHENDINPDLAGQSIRARVVRRVRWAGACLAPVTALGWVDYVLVRPTGVARVGFAIVLGLLTVFAVWSIEQSWRRCPPIGREFPVPAWKDWGSIVVLTIGVASVPVVVLILIGMLASFFLEIEL